ncbi:MAG: hypothetical protein A2Y82_00205 [Candidatus Buchananbacteria bacterium RBG_13_36_9]|uniref:Uncharacterized protein n=1 Tax=Candidatus Buchananbacteria bacterium RBG_13_36_9 TaxID=1797530 RepID=A0A1G1XMN2_9BACT|nr:MAG: hypothetical protein A2Y82_00205 [Candidatus Buchananbacteria bacterium RBG_13_36_9]
MQVIRVTEFPQKKVCKKCKKDWKEKENFDGKCQHCGCKETKWVHYDPGTKEIVEIPRLGL